MVRPALRVDDSLTAGELAKRAKRQQDARIRARILAIRYMRLGHTVPEAANALGVSERQLRTWVHRYNAEGIQGLREASRTRRLSSGASVAPPPLVHSTSIPPPGNGRLPVPKPAR